MFSPSPGQTLRIKDHRYAFDSHPNAPQLVYGQEGRKAVVYRLRDSQGFLYALKVFKAAYRDRRIETTAQLLQRYKALPGMDVANRLVLSSSNEENLIGEYPELQYAILMPWINGETCFELFSRKIEISKKKSISVSSHIAQALFSLEKNKLAHSDISGTNVLIDLVTSEIALVGLENLFGPDFPRPSFIPLGTPGYIHPYIDPKGSWFHAADRFAGALLISTLLGWPYSEIRNSAWGESYFDQNEIGKPCERYQILHSAIHETNKEIAQLLSKAWFSLNLLDCPTFMSWNTALAQLSL